LLKLDVEDEQYFDSIFFVGTDVVDEEEEVERLCVSCFLNREEGPGFGLVTADIMLSWYGWGSALVFRRLKPEGVIL